jgi:hypothetical protein
VDKVHAELLVQLVTGHAPMAMMFLRLHPNQSGASEVARPQVAKIYIGQLEMLQAKIRGNLSAAEAKLLNDMPMATRGAFAGALDAPGSDREDVAPAV